MKIARGNLWTYPADWRVITTNGFVKKSGEAVMGRGTAYQAKKRWPKLPYAVGLFLNAHGNHVGEFVFKDPETFDEIKLITMPTKHNWWEEADLLLIERSCVEMASLPYSESFVVAAPGCGNGKLDWADVKLVIEPILDDRFTVLV
jgi:hypothetical protein